MPFRPLSYGLAASLLLGGVPPAGAQPAALPPLSPPASQPAAPQPPTAPPPGRVGRIAAVTGPVSFHLSGATEWQVASPNLPLTDGTALWVAPGGEAALGLGAGNRIVLGPSTEFDIDRLDDQTLAATQSQGESYLHLSVLAPGETYTVRTPRGIMTIAAAGRYAIESGDIEHPTTVTVLDGAATLSGIPATAEISPGQTLTITGDGAGTPFSPSVGPAMQDAFLRHVLAEERPPAPRPARAPAIVAQMTGADALDEVGEWSDNAEYGPVWFPPVATYVPYRQGRWAYVAPWGWTWVDDAPWGFAPSHYGRWSEFGGRWGWVPGRDWGPDRRPVYAPALVGFLGGAALGFGRGPMIGWAPLGPRDAYRPPYPADERIVQVLNQPTGANIRIVNAPVTINRTALTIVPTQVLTTSAPVAGAFRPGPLPASFGPSSVLQFRPPAAPTRATIGATPTVLRQVNPPGLTAPAAHVGPGPALAQAPSPSPQIGPAALVGGAAVGAPAGGLLPPPPARNAGLPDLRARGIGAAVPGASRPLPPARPVVAGPQAPHPPADLLGGAPGPGRPDILAGPRPVPLQGPQREPAVIPHREPPVPLRQEQRVAAPRAPRQEPVAVPHPAAPRPPPPQHAAAAPPAQHAPLPQHEHREEEPHR